MFNFKNNYLITLKKNYVLIIIAIKTLKKLNVIIEKIKRILDFNLVDLKVKLLL